MKNDGWACRRGLPIPATIAIGWGIGGRQAPRHRHADPLPEHSVLINHLPHAARRGLCPRTPEHDWTGKAAQEPEGANPISPQSQPAGGPGGCRSPGIGMPILFPNTEYRSTAFSASLQVLDREGQGEIQKMETGHPCPDRSFASIKPSPVKTIS